VSDQPRGDGYFSSKPEIVRQRTISQQGVDFTWTANTFDNRGRPLNVTKASTLGYTRSETTAYWDHTAKWILGQVASVTESSTGALMVANGYDANFGTQTSVSHFGHLDASMTYYGDGTLATRSDGLNHATTYSNYKRGLAQNISYPDGATESAAVNTYGAITSTTDPYGYVTQYGYDAMGRLASVSLGAGDTVAWNPTTISFQQVQGAEYDLAASHWRQDITTGNSRKSTYFDALWRPVYVYTADLGNPGATSRIIKRSYDFAGRTTFESYPERNHTPAFKGVTTTYDALGRSVQTNTDSELGALVASSYYGGLFQKTSTDARGNTTVTSYQAFDQPAEAVSNITAPEGVNVAIARDVFGKSTAITRSGGGKSATRSYVYDGAQRLCKTIEPETGATVQDYDAANNVLWRASGLSLPSASCDIASVPAGNKIAFGYDPSNRLTTTSYSDGSPSITRTYTLDGLPATISADGSAWTNSYNKRRLNVLESLAYGGAAYNISRAYDANGSLSQLTYPDGSAIGYSPNALGEPQQVGAYATSITYHPNGAIAGFSYGNGVGRSLTQNLRRLPETAVDTGALNDRYSYDQNGNVAAIADQYWGTNSRSMAYDGLDRLTSVAAPSLWGTSSYSYDALDNLTGNTITAGATARSVGFNYPDPATNRLMSVSGSAGYNFSYAYDSQGNIVQRGGQQYTFDQGNRLTSAPGIATYRYDGLGHRVSVIGTDGVNRLQLYSQGGQILQAGPVGGAATRYVYLHNHVLAEVGPSGTQYQHTDALGSPVARTDGAGNVVSQTKYEPYGKTAQGATPTLGFTGHVNDADTALVYMQQRYYDPVAGRFLSIDPVTTDANTGGSFNRYAYASNSPYNYVDPDGRQERPAEAFGDQFRNDAASGNSGVYEPFHAPVVIATIGMVVGPPIAAAAIAGAPVEATVAAGAAAKTTTIVAKNGVEIKSIARHAVDRAIGDGGKRAGVGPKGILDSLKNPLKITETKTDELGRASQRFIGKDATTAVNPETGKIVSVNPTSTRTAEKLIKASE
jgi:RHS repeat-associated protein